MAGTALPPPAKVCRPLQKPARAAVLAGMTLLSPDDLPTLAIVLGGTVLATVLRAGLADARAVLHALSGTMRRTFDADLVRSELAVQIREIQQDGLLRAKPHQFGDREFDEATEAMIGHRSLSALLSAHEGHRARRLALAGAAARTLALAAELAPVFGLFGTLVSLGRLPENGIDRGAYMAAIGMAVHATLYGLIAANILFAPLARLVERRAMAEEAERQRLIDWLTRQLEPVAHPPARAVA